MKALIYETKEIIDIERDGEYYVGYSEMIKDNVILNYSEFEIVEDIIKKLYICEVSDFYAGGMCLIEAENIKEAKEALESDKFCGHNYNSSKIREIIGATIKSKTPYPQVIEENSYFE